MPLYINNVKFDRISGPTSFTILTSETNNIMLFGDKHLSSKNQCQGQDEGTSLSDPEFLNALNLEPSIVMVELYHFPLGRDLSLLDPTNQKFVIKNRRFLDLYYKNRLNEPMIKFVRSVSPCIFQESKEQPWFNQYCPYNNIEWMFVDLRQHVNNIPADYPYIYEILINTILLAIQNNRFSNLVDIIKTKAKLMKVNAIDLVMDLKNAIYSAMFEPGTVAIYLFDPKYVNHSYLAKELARLDVPRWQTMITEYFEANLYLQHDVELDIKAEMYIDNIFDNLRLELLGLKVEWKSSSNYVKLLTLDFGARLVDVYAIMRLFNRNSYARTKLIMGYLGQEHLRGLTYFLTNITKTHQLRYMIENLNDNRCLDFKDVNLEL